MGTFTSVMIQPPKALGNRAFPGRLGIAAVACQECASATMCIGKRATHFAKMSRLHILTTVKAKDCTVFKVINGQHHSFLGMPTLCLPFFLLSFLFFGSIYSLYQGLCLIGKTWPPSCIPRRSLNRSEKTVSHIPRLFKASEETLPPYPVLRKRLCAVNL